MNIFFLDKDPVLAAQALTDVHIVSQMKESCQMLATAWRVCGQEALQNTLQAHSWYKFPAVAHKNHPCSVWVRESQANYKWLVDHLIAMQNVWREREGNTYRTHKMLDDCENWLLYFSPKDLPQIGLTTPALCVGDRVIAQNRYIPSSWNSYLDYVVFMYREYYRLYKVTPQSYRHNKERTPKWL